MAVGVAEAGWAAAGVMGEGWVVVAVIGVGLAAVGVMGMGWGRLGVMVKGWGQVVTGEGCAVVGMAAVERDKVREIGRGVVREVEGKAVNEMGVKVERAEEVMPGMGRK